MCHVSFICKLMRISYKSCEFRVLSLVIFTPCKWTPLILGGSLQMQPTYIVYYGLSRQHFRSFWIYFQDLDFVVASIFWTDLSIHLWYTQILWETWDSLVITWMLCCWNRMERIKCMFLMLNLYNQTSNHENAIIKIGKILSFYEYIINGFYHTLLSSNLNIKFNM